MLKSIEILVWRLVQYKQEKWAPSWYCLLFLEYFSLVYLYSGMCIIFQHNLHAIIVCLFLFSFKRKDIPDKCMFHSQLCPVNSVLSHCMVMQLLLDMLKKWQYLSHQSPCSDPCAFLAMQVTTLAFWVKQGLWGTAAVFQLPQSLH